MRATPVRIDSLREELARRVGPAPTATPRPRPLQAPPGGLLLTTPGGDAGLFSAEALRLAGLADAAEPAPPAAAPVAARHLDAIA